jgi:hypothetical protein
MPKKRAKPFAKQLAQYGVLSAIMAAGTNADGQIIYTDENPNFVGGNTSQYFLDLNNDGDDDFRIYGHHAYGNGYSSIGLAVQPLGSSNISNGIMTDNGDHYALALSAGEAINNTGNFNSSTNGVTMNVQSGDICAGAWCDATDKFIGFQFKIAGVIHYGWARMDANADFNNGSWVLKDYAYESEAGVGIVAGAVMSVGTEDTNLDNIVEFFPNPTTGQLVLVKNNTVDLLSAEIMDVNGTVLKRIDLTQTPQTTTLSMEGFASGMYFIRVNTSETSGVTKIIKE